jgi:hypothetical protein
MLTTSIFAQSESPFLDWYQKAGQGQQVFDYENATVTDNLYNVYVAGATLNASGDYDLLLVKYDKYGTELWSETWAGAANGHDLAGDLIIDSSGDLIVTGATFTGNGSAEDYDMLLMKYDDAGNQIWENTFDGPANSYDGGIALELDDQDNIYVSAGSYGISGGITTLSDFSAQKYSTAGSLQWETRFDDSGMMDVPAKMTWKSSNNTVYVSGAAQVSSSSWKMLTLEMNDSNGSIISTYSSGSNSSNIDQVTDLATDGTYFYVTGNIEVSGEGKNMKLVKLDDDLTELWSVEWNGTSDQDDKAGGVIADNNGNVYITGFTTSSDGDTDYALVKYNSSGTQQWEEIWDGPEGGNDRGVKLKMDGSDIVSCGDTYRDGNLDMLLFKHDDAGNLNWKTFLNTDANKNDEAVNIGLEGNEIYLSGKAETTAGNYTYVTAKYTQRDTYVPAESEDTPAYVNFQDNHGQLRSTGGGSDTIAKVYYNQRNPQFYANDEFYSLVYSDQNDTTQTLHRVDVSFKDSDRGTVYTHGEKKYFSNYFLGHQDNPVYRNFANDRAIHYELYKGIDFIYTADKDGYKVYAVVTPAGDPSDIELEYDGQSALSVNLAGDLEIDTDLGTKTQTRPQAYTMNTSTGALTELGWDGHYSIQNDIVSINTGSFSPTDVLVLEWGAEEITAGQEVLDDYNLSWSTFFGGPGRDEIHDISNGLGNDDFAWFAGETDSPQFPEFQGQVQGDLEALIDGFIAKFDRESPEVFTYYGGSDFDAFYAVDVGPDGHIHAAGTTESDDFDIQSSNGLDLEYNSGIEGFYVEFDANYFTLSDSYVGGEGDDEVWSIALDYDSDFDMDYEVYLTGHSTDDQNFPEMSQSGAYNQSFNGAPTDDSNGFIIKLDENRDQVWGTFYGGARPDYITDAEVVDGKLVIVGSAATRYYATNNCAEPTGIGFPSCNQGSTWQQPNFILGSASNKNTFVAAFNDDDDLIYSSFFGLGDQYVTPQRRPHIAGITHSGNSHNFYISGTTPNDEVDQFPSSPFPSPGYNQDFADEEPLNGGNSGFIAKFELIDDGSNPNTVDFEGSTFYGSSGSMVNMAIAIQYGESTYEDVVYVAGREFIEAVQTSYCQVPTSGEFPTCDDGISLDMYVETGIDGINNRSFVAAFTEDEMEMVWSTEFGAGRNNGLNAISSSDYFVFAGGYSEENYTLLEGLLGGYFQDYLSGSRDGAISMFRPPWDIIFSVEDDENDSTSDSFLIYPNPSDGNFQLAFEEAKNREFIKIHDISGRLIKHIELSKGVSNYQLNIQNVESGIYVVSYHQQDGSNETKLFEKL